MRISDWSSDVCSSDLPFETLTMTLADGDVVIKLRPDLAPEHVARISELANEGFYDGVVFHRVIPGFMAQGGDPTGTGTGGSAKPDLPAAFSREPRSEERRVGKECGRQCRSRLSPYH